MLYFPNLSSTSRTPREFPNNSTSFLPTTKCLRFPPTMPTTTPTKIAHFPSEWLSSEDRKKICCKQFETWASSTTNQILYKVELDLPRRRDKMIKERFPFLFWVQEFQAFWRFHFNEIQDEGEGTPQSFIWKPGLHDSVLQILRRLHKEFFVCRSIWNFVKWKAPSFSHY